MDPRIRTSRPVHLVSIALALFTAAAATVAMTMYRDGSGVATAASITSPDALRGLVDQDGRSFSFERLKGRTVVMNFIFTHCAVSGPQQTRALAEIQRALPAPLRERVQFVSVSMDPARDTAPVLKQFASGVGADLAGWSFVTGDEHEIDWLHRHYNLQVEKTDGDPLDHRVIVYLLDSGGRLIQRFTGELDQFRVAQEIGTVDSLKETGI
jgi:protein SCO1/2